ncbi:MAG: hypothetical protein PGN24_03100 [Microbacterium arborescens]
MLARRRASTLLVLGVLLLAGCAGEAAVFGPSVSPSPSSSPPSDEELAFRAAEETYRAYVDALNEVDLADPSTFEPVFALTTGDVNAADRRNLDHYHAERVQLAGDMRVLSLEGARLTADTVSVGVCLDVSNVSLTSPDGSSLVDPNRAPLQSLEVSLERSTPSRISQIAAANEEQC